MMENKHNDHALGPTLDHWQEQVLDLSRRNNLVDFTETKTKSLPLIGGEPETVLEVVLADESLNIRKQGSPPETQSQADGVLGSTRSPEETQESLEAISHYHRQYLRERGVDTLFLSLYGLRWAPGESAEFLHSPLFLLPVDLEQAPTTGSDQHSYVIRYTGDDPIQVNPALRKKLAFEREVTVDIEEVQPANLTEALDRVQTVSESFDVWEVTDEIALCIFDFANISLYEDIERNRETLESNPLVRALAGDTTGLTEETTNETPTEDNEKKRYQVLEADPSQRQTIDAAIEGKSFVIQGPPGTGKSQTIANIIAEKLGRRERILFVSEKQAALDVVKSRLDEVGLGRFCLEMHGKHAATSSVINSLQSELHADSVARPTDWFETKRRRDDVQESLDAYHDLLTSPPEDFDVTPYEALGIVARSADRPTVEAGIASPFAHDQSTVNEAIDRLRELENFKDPIENYTTHPWRETTVSDWQLDVRDQMEQSLTDQIATLEEVQSLSEQLEKQFGLTIDRPEQIPTVRDTLEQLGFAPRDHWQPALLDPTFYRKQSAVRVLAETHCEIAELEAYLRKRYESTVYEEDGGARHQELSRYGLFRYVRPSYYQLKRQLCSHTRDGYAPDLAELHTDVRKLRRLQSLREKAAEMTVDEKYLEPFETDSGVDWDLVLGVQDWLRAIASTDVIQFAHADGKLEVDDFDAVASLYHDLDQLAERYASAWEFFEQSMDRGAITVDGDPLTDTAIESRIQYLKHLRSNIKRLQDWVQFQQRRTELGDTIAGTFLENFLAAGHDPEWLAAGFKREFYRAWLNELYERTPLSTFNADEFDHYLQEYRRLDRHVIEQASQAVQHQVTKRQPDPETEHATTTGEIVLNRELQKQRNWRSLRELFGTAGAAVQQLKPCFMMSPLTVAQYLEHDEIDFDVVIFDEASQIPPARAVSALIRGEQVIVAGDSKQLPPTRFFETDIVDPENGRVDLESILDECAAILPERRLCWHYRSQSTELIEFSNDRYYDGQLKTFPKPAATEGTGLAFEYVEDGVYDRGETRTNAIEAEHVVDFVETHAVESPGQSLGIVAFSRAQERAIRDALSRRRTESPELDEFVAQEDIQEGFFIKSLEVVQGDERDRIIFSVGYGPDENGEVTMNFGPLNEVGGQRRLNVAITRARQQVTVVSSITPEEIDPSRTSSRGVTDFKRYLSYVRDHSTDEKPENQTTQTGADGAFRGPIEADIYRTLTAEGFTVDVMPPQEEAMIEMAIRDPDDPSRYALGIICDGTAHRETSSTRDRDRLRRQVFEANAWDIHRIWAPEWAVDADSVCRKLEQRIN